MGKSISLEEYIHRAKLRHGDEYDYSRVVYVSGKSKIEIKHNICNQWSFVFAANHAMGSRCPYCYKTKLKTTQEYISEAKSIHGDQFDYSEVVYVSAIAKIKITCNSCKHPSYPVAVAHIKKTKPTKCRNCWDSNPRKTHEKFKEEAIKLHGGNYCYDKFVYEKSDTSSVIICNKCNCEFKQTPHHHLRKLQNCGGCPNLCWSNKQHDIKSFIEKSNQTHEENHYDYSQTIYENSLKNVKIWCNKCQMYFWQVAFTHMNGSNCRRCIKQKYVSSLEIEWLNKLKIDFSNRQIRLPKYKKYTVDALVGNTVYEFYGDYWHGNPKIYHGNKMNYRSKSTMGKLYRNLVKRHNKISTLGYEIKFVWESDWNNGLDFSCNL